jgi:hypothetical protein
MTALVKTPSFNFSRDRFRIVTITGKLLFAYDGGQVLATGKGKKCVSRGATLQINGVTGKYTRASRDSF